MPRVVSRGRNRPPGPVEAVPRRPGRRVLRGAIQSLSHPSSGADSMGRLGAGTFVLLVLGVTIGGGQGPAGRPSPPTGVEQPGTCRFPADRAIGVLYTRPGEARDWPGAGWVRLGEAIGEVAIPPGRQVRLELG